jgi:hypothetical protein
MIIHQLDIPTSFEEDSISNQELHALHFGVQSAKCVWKFVGLL